MVHLRKFFKVWEGNWKYNEMRNDIWHTCSYVRAIYGCPLKNAAMLFSNIKTGNHSWESIEISRNAWNIGLHKLKNVRKFSQNNQNRRIIGEIWVENDRGSEKHEKIWGTHLKHVTTIRQNKPNLRLIGEIWVKNDRGSQKHEKYWGRNQKHVT